MAEEGDLEAGETEKEEEDADEKPLEKEEAPAEPEPQPEPDKKEKKKKKKGPRCCRCCADHCCKCCRERCCRWCFKPGLRRGWHWYRCSYSLFPLTILSILGVFFEIFFLAISFLRGPVSSFNLVLLILPLPASILIISLIEVTFFFIHNEFSSWQSRLIYALFFLFTLGLVITALLWTYRCEICDADAIDNFDSASLLTVPENERSGVQMLRFVRWGSVVKVFFVLCVLHVYMFYACMLWREKHEQEDPMCRAGWERIRAARAIKGYKRRRKGLLPDPGTDGEEGEDGSHLLPESKGVKLAYMNI